MTANFVIELRRALDIDDVAQRQIAEVGQAQRFLDQIEADAVAFHRGHGQAAAVMGHRRAQLQPRQQLGRHLDDVGAEIGFLINGDQRRGALYDTGEHMCLFLLIG